MQHPHETDMETFLVLIEGSERRKRSMSVRVRVIWMAMVAALSLALAACSASTTTIPTPTAAGNSNGGSTTPTPGSGSGGGQTANLTFQVNFSGMDTVQGSFTTTEWASFTCSDFAKSSFVWNLGVGPQEGAPTTVSGKLINFLISAPNKMFHGVGTYMDVLPAGVTVEGDDFSGTDSTMTINSDGSGNASFTNLPGSGSASGQTESGTVTWTCG